MLKTRHLRYFISETTKNKSKIDFAFKEIRETTILNTSLRREHEDDKQGILDVRLMLNSEQEIDIEIQLSELTVWADRSLFYLAKMFTGQIKPGESCRTFKKCVCISILDFSLFRDETEFYSCFHISEDTRHFVYTDKMEFHVIELPGELRENSTDIELWAEFISAERKEEFDMLAQKDPYIESAYQKLQMISQDREKQKNITKCKGHKIET